MTEDIRAEIVRHPSDDATVIAKDLSQRFNKFIPPATVAQILATSHRTRNVGIAKGKASETLDSKLMTMEHVSSKLLATFNDPTVPLKDRIEAAKELRQWTKLGIDMSGIHDAESDTLFVIDAEWASRTIDV
jgi:hypothetical protein